MSNTLNGRWALKAVGYGIDVRSLDRQKIWRQACLYLFLIATRVEQLSSINKPEGFLKGVRNF